jgi:hypothetical protein
MNVSRKQGDNGWFRHQAETRRSARGEKRRTVAVSEERTCTRTACLKSGRQHGPCGLGKLALRGHLGTEIGESFHGSQKAPEIVFLHGHALGGIPEQKKSITQRVNNLVS